MRQKVNPSEKPTTAWAFPSDLGRIQNLRRKHGLDNQPEMIRYALDAVEREDASKARPKAKAERGQENGV